MKLILSIAVLFSANVFAADLESRYEAGRAALSSEVGKAYERSVAKHIHSTLLICLPPGSPPLKGTLTLVADISGTGQLSDVAAEPENEATRCMVEYLSKLVFPEPPKTEEGAFPFSARIKLSK